MQVRAHDARDIARVNPQGAQGILEPGRIPLVLDSVDIAELRVILVADRRVHEHVSFRCLDKQTTHRQLYPVPVIW